MDLSVNVTSGLSGTSDDMDLAVVDIRIPVASGKASRTPGGLIIQ